MTIIKRELQRGLDLSESIMVGKRPWSDLFVKHTFFTAGYKYYISVISASKAKEAHKTWSGYVESKIRMLVQKLEQHPSIALAHAFNKGYDRRHHCRDDGEIEQVQEGSLNFLAAEDVQLELEAKQGPVVKQEPGSREEPEVQEPTAQESTVQDLGVKQELQENGNAMADAGPTEVFTTTHYIGIELIGSKSCCPPRLSP